jgi:XTP/dITP diphosphohydrolase
MTPRGLTLVLATNNRHKVSEIRAILRKAGLRATVLTLDAFPRRKPTVENRPTLEGNSAKKAVEIARHTGHWALADDTGLFVRALDGRPGVYSARFAGPGCTFEDNNRKLLRLLKSVPTGRRGAAFRCVAALANPSGRVWLVKGRLNGRISEALTGAHGFGYDPVFYVPALKKTLAQMSAALKNRISHRSQAFGKIPALVRRVIRPASRPTTIL